MAVHPTSVKNSHFGHFLFWVFFLPLLSIIAFPLLLPEQNIEQAEVEMVRTLNVDTSKLQEKTNATFSHLFIKTGVMGASENFFAPKDQVQGGMLTGGWAAKWIRGVWLIVYKTIWRIYALWWIFVVPVVALCVPAAIDGLVVRARKKYQFQTSNPVFFYSSAHIATMALGLFFFLPVAPVTLSAYALFGLILAMAASVWVTAANFQTGS